MKKVEHRKGFTLVEMVVTMTLLAIFFASTVVILGSFTRVYYRVQELNRAQLISDIILQSVEEQLKSATRINEIYPVTGEDQVILFTDSDGMFRLFDTRGGIRSVVGYDGDSIETMEGQLWLSYYYTEPNISDAVLETDELSYTTPNGVEQIMGSSFYKNNQIKLSFEPSYEDEVGSNKVQYMIITVEVWLNEQQITNDKGVIQMQYRPEYIIG